VKTEDVLLDVKEIFRKRKVIYHQHDVAHARHVCRQIIEYIIESERRKER